MNISYYINARDNETKEMDVMEIFHSIASDKRKDAILAIRSENDPNRRDQMKRNLDMVAFSCIMTPQRGIKYVKSSTHLAAIDIDHGPNGEVYDFDLLRKKLVIDDYVMALFSSPSGRLKIVVQHDWDETDNEEYHKFYEQLRQYFSKYAYSDPVTNSIVSTTFLSWDPDLYLNVQSKVFHYTPAAMSPSSICGSSIKSVSQFKQPKLRAVPLLNDNDAYDYMESIAPYYDFKDHRNNHLYAFSCQCAQNGVQSKSVRIFVEDIILADDFLMDEIVKTINSAYKAVNGQNP